MAAFDVVVIVGSQGAIGEHVALLERLPPHWQAPIVVVQHRPPHVDPARMLGTRLALPVVQVTPLGPLEPATIHVAGGRSWIEFGADRSVRNHEIDAQPPQTADRTLASAAAAFGPRVIAVVLSGRLHDGAAGVRAVREAGGRVLVQDPSTAQAPDMPLAALATGCAELVLPTPALADALTSFTLMPGAADLFRVAPSPWAAYSAASSHQ